MTILDNALAHFDRNRSKLLSVDVPEWGTEDVPGKVYFYAVPTIEEKAAIRRELLVDDVRGTLKLLCLRALDASGQPIFAVADFDRWLVALDPDIAARVASQIEVESKKYRAEAEEQLRD